MTHVMVPCPEEHVPELKAGLMRLAFGNAGWNDERIGHFADDLAPEERELVRLVAQRTADHDHLTYREAAAHLGIDVGDVLDIVTDINDRCREANRPLPLVTDTAAVQGPDGQARPSPVLVVMPAIAARLLAATGGVPAATGSLVDLDVPDA